MEIVKNSLQRWFQVQRMKGVRHGITEKWFAAFERIKRADLDVSLSLYLAILR